MTPMSPSRRPAGDQRAMALTHLQRAEPRSIRVSSHSIKIGSRRTLVDAKRIASRELLPGRPRRRNALNRYRDAIPSRRRSQNA